MGIKKVRIRIGLDGRTQFKVEGGQGADCIDFTRALEQAVGNVENRELAALLHLRRPFRRLAAARSHRNPHQVGFNRCRVDDTRIDCVQPAREPLRGAMVLGQPLDHVFERDDAGGGDRPRLAHVAADHAPETARAFGELAAAADQRADRRRQAF